MSTLVPQAPPRLRSDERGSAGVVFAIAIIPIVAALGAAIDYGRSLSTQQRLQSAVDAAAMAAASAPSGADPKAVAAATFKANVSGNALLANIPANVVADGKTIRVDAKKDVPTTFARILKIDSIRVAAKSAAEQGSPTQTGGRACLLALEESDYGIKINGGGTGSHIDTNCGVYVNSASSSAIFGNNKGSITSKYTCVNGNYDRGPAYRPTPQTACPRMADPFVGLAAPSIGACTYNNKKVKGTATLQPGVYCGGLDIDGDADVSFEPGDYIIKNGQFKIGSHAEARGNRVFFYLTGNNARIDWGSHSVTNFKAQTSGTYKGILVWAAEPLSNAHRIGCHGASVLQGAVYIPNAEIDIQSSGDVFGSADWTVWVVKKLQLSSSAKLALSSNFENSSTPLPTALANGGMVYSPPTRPARLTQ